MARSRFLTSARSAALLLFSLLGSLLACSAAHAADRGEAFALCNAAIARTMAKYGPVTANNWPRVEINCRESVGPPELQKGSFAASVLVNPSTPVCISSEGAVPSSSCNFEYRGSCESRPDWNGAYPYLTGGAPKNGSVTCNAGCKQAWYSTGDGYFNGKYSSVPGTCSNYDDAKCKSDFGSGYYWNGAMSSCEPEAGKCKDGATPNSQGQCKPEPCPEGKVQNADGTCQNKKNECPAGNVKAPSGECLPGDGQCAAGEAKGKDGTCKRDSNGDGKPDSEEGDDDPSKDSASGGENCSSPPSCNGNPVMCLQLRTQWRIDCNTRRDRNVTGGSCGAMPVCVGKDCDATEHAQLIQQWKSACALEKLANKTGDGGGDDGQPEWTKAGGMNQDPGKGQNAGDEPKLNTMKFNTSDLDQTGFGGGSCIGFAGGDGGQLVSGFMSVLASPPPFWCNFIAMVKAVFVLVGTVAAVVITAKGA